MFSEVVKRYIPSRILQRREQRSRMHRGIVGRTELGLFNSGSLLVDLDEAVDIPDNLHRRRESSPFQIFRNSRRSHAEPLLR